MTLADAYPLVRPAHIVLVLASGGLFVVRGWAVLMGASWPTTRPVRSLSYAIDTALLAAGVTLAIALALDPLRVPWLGVKLALLPVYVVLGWLALRARSGRVLWFLAAVLCYVFMFSIARMREPLGLARWILP